jgi:RND family efflux transporter MFP subunit
MIGFRWEFSIVLGLASLTVWLVLVGRWPGWLAGEQETVVEVVRVSKSSIPEEIRVTGTVMPVSEVDVVSPFSGRVSELRVKTGDAVRVGAVVGAVYASELAERQDELVGAVKSARKELDEKERQQEEAERFAARVRELFQQDLIARSEMENAVAAEQTARAEIELARARLHQQEAMLTQAQKIQSLSQIPAPNAGVISRVWVRPGSLVGKGNPIVSIASSNPIRVVGRVSGAQAAMLREGLSAVVRLGDGIDGIVSRVVFSQGDDIPSAEVEIAIKTAVTQLRFGAATDAVISLESISPSYRVPRSAVFKCAGSDCVYKISAGRAVRQEVKTSAQDPNGVVIEQGLHEGDLIIADKPDRLKNSSQVRPVGTAPD